MINPEMHVAIVSMRLKHPMVEQSQKWKSKRMVMFGDSRNHRKREATKAKYPKKIVQVKLQMKLLQMVPSFSFSLNMSDDLVNVAYFLFVKMFHIFPQEVLDYEITLG